MSVIRSLTRAALPLSFLALMGASCTSILGDDFEIGSDGGEDGSGSGNNTSGGGGVCDVSNQCRDCACDFCEDDANECLEDPSCIACLSGDDDACLDGDTDLYLRAGDCLYSTCDVECLDSSPLG
jgi:hypothetical protein